MGTVASRAAGTVIQARSIPGTGVIKLWGPHDFGDPTSPKLYKYGDPFVNLGPP